MLKMYMKGKVALFVTFLLGVFCFYLYQKRITYQQARDDEIAVRIASISFTSLTKQDVDIMYGIKKEPKKYLRAAGNSI